MTQSKTVFGVIVAAPSSGSGKTVITLGILAALKARGIDVGSLKAGPDYIDPVFHAKATGRSCFNIDPWAMRPETIAGLIHEAGRATDLMVAEGVMGLFDGATLDMGSTADIAKLTGWPIVLVVDSGSQGASAAAQVLGFDRYRDDINIAGVIFNRVGSQKHQNVIRQSLSRVLPDMPILGMIPWHSELELPSRHLGLVQAGEHLALNAIIQGAADTVKRHVDLQALQAMALGWKADGSAQPLKPLGQHIAVASDKAFAFAYPQVLQGWRMQGAELSFFSPLDDQAPNENADAVFLPGGYPELHADRLARAETFKSAIKNAATAGMVIYGECGGYMVLGEGIVDKDGQTHEMLGLLPLQTSFAERKLHLGYRQLTALSDTPLGGKGAKFKAHEFHYATTVNQGFAEPLYEALDVENTKLANLGLKMNNVFGSFAHLIDQSHR